MKMGKYNILVIASVLLYIYIHNSDVDIQVGHQQATEYVTSAQQCLQSDKGAGLMALLYTREDTWHITVINGSLSLSLSLQSSGRDVYNGRFAVRSDDLVRMRMDKHRGRPLIVQTMDFCYMEVHGLNNTSNSNLNQTPQHGQFVDKSGSGRAEPNILTCPAVGLGVFVSAGDQFVIDKSQTRPQVPFYSLSAACPFSGVRTFGSCCIGAFLPCNESEPLPTRFDPSTSPVYTERGSENV